MFNAACFFSRAIWLLPQYLPDGFTLQEWRRCCAQASIHELGLIHRDPRNTLDPNWMARDPDLEPLRQTDVGGAWMAFIGFRPTRAGEASPMARSPRRSHRELALRELALRGLSSRAGRRARDGNGTSGDSSPP